MQNLKTIEIAGFLSEKETEKGKTAIWFNNGIEVVLNYDDNDYSFSDSEIEGELVKAQDFVNKKVQENVWAIAPVARVVVNKL